MDTKMKSIEQSTMILMIQLVNNTTFVGEDGGRQHHI